MLNNRDMLIIVDELNGRLNSLRALVDFESKGKRKEMEKELRIRIKDLEEVLMHMRQEERSLKVVNG